MLLSSLVHQMRFRNLVDRGLHLLEKEYRVWQMMKIIRSYNIEII